MSYKYPGRVQLVITNLALWNFFSFRYMKLLSSEDSKLTDHADIDFVELWHWIQNV